MKIAILICCSLALALLALLGLSYTPATSLEVSVTEVDDGVIIQNVGNVACLVFVSSPEGEQQFELAVGKNVTVIGISRPIDVSAVAPPTAELFPTVETPLASDVQITHIFYDGIVYRTESDEYVEITNLGDTSQDLKGWVLKDISEGYPSFTFPSYVIDPGAQIRVYTNEIHSEWGGFSFGYSKAIWNNTDHDWAALYNSQGQEVSRKSY
jgi:hypothetical protein